MRKGPPNERNSISFSRPVPSLSATASTPMQRTITFALFVFAVGHHLFAQDPYAALRNELERIHEADQHDRHTITTFIGAQRDSVAAHMAWQDSVHLVRVRTIIDSAGWLGPAEVGTQASQALWLVLQHADAQPAVQAAYLPVMREAVAAGKAQANDLALLEDRVAVNHGRPQIYGSQVYTKDGRNTFRPIADEEHVNERRAAVGLEPLEAYAERFGFHWSPPVKQERVLLTPVGNH